MKEVIEIFGKRGNCYFPIVLLDLAALREKGMGHEFMLRYTGQISQLNVQPAECACRTPQEGNPEQSSNCSTDGKPGRDCKCVETVTVFFATGQSNA